MHYIVHYIVHDVVPYMVHYTVHYMAQMFAGDGSCLRAFGGHGSRPGEFNMPVGVAVGRGAAGDELIVVTDQGNGRVQVCSARPATRRGGGCSPLAAEAALLCSS